MSTIDHFNGVVQQGVERLRKLPGQALEALTHTSDQVRLGGSGDFYVSLRVFESDEEAFFQKWDRALDLLAFGEDAVALKEYRFDSPTRKIGSL